MKGMKGFICVEDTNGNQAFYRHDAIAGFCKMGAGEGSILFRYSGDSSDYKASTPHLVKTPVAEIVRQMAVAMEESQ